MSDDDFMKELQSDFISEAKFLLEQCEESYLKLEQESCRVEELDKIFRMAHSMKGAGAAVGFSDLAEFAHKVEDCLTLLRVHPDQVTTKIVSLLLRCGDALKKKIEILRESSSEPWNVQELLVEVASAVTELGGKSSASKPEVEKQEEPKDSEPQNKPEQLATARESASNASQSVKVDTGRIDSVLNLVGELVVLKSQLINEVSKIDSNAKMEGIVGLIDKSIRELQDRALGMRMTPLKPVFLKTQRIVRDLSVKLNKAVNFQTSGEETEIDRTMVELLGDPLMHIARNALDHGLEDQDTRVKRGKAPVGTIMLTAKQLGGKILVRVQDDGGGLNREKIFAKALERGLIAQGSDLGKLSDKEIFQFIFLPGFSTAEKITDVSGRGVGMDVVKSNIQKINGTIEIESTLEKGTGFNILIPITTSISDGFLILVSGHPFVIPLDNVLELVDLRTLEIVGMANGSKVIPLRGNMIPLLDLSGVLGDECEELNRQQVPQPGKRLDGMAVIINYGQQRYALKVQTVVSQIQVVLKPLGASFEKSKSVAGAAILGDGKVALVLDMDGVISQGLVAA